jgi:Na+/melibiose symporter-like transporter
LVPTPGFRRLLAAEVVSNFGSMLTRLVIPWVAALVLEASPFEMGLLLVADVVAGAAGSLVLGTLVDRASKRRVMIGADLARAAIIALLALAVWRGVATIPLLIVAAAGSGLLSITFELARSAWIAQNVPARALTVRNSQLSAAGSVTEAVSFGVGGWIYQALGGALSLAADAVSYLVSAAFLWRMPERRRAAPAATGWPRAADVWADARAGVAALWRERTLRALAVLEVLVALGMSLAGTSYMIYVAREIGFDTGVLGMIFAVGGVGSALGAALAPAFGRRAGSGMAIVSGLLLLAVGAALVPLAGAATWLGAVLLVGHQLVGDAGHVLYDIHDRTLRQSVTPGELLARVDAGIRTLGQSATLAGALAGGTLAVVIGARGALIVSAGMFAVAAAVALALPGLRRR